MTTQTPHPPFRIDLPRPTGAPMAPPAIEARVAPGAQVIEVRYVSEPTAPAPPVWTLALTPSAKGHQAEVQVRFATDDADTVEATLRRLLSIAALAQAGALALPEAARMLAAGDLAACIDRAERSGLRLSNNTWRAALVCSHPTFALVTWLVERGTAPTLVALRERLGESGVDVAVFLCGFGVLALAADGQTLAVTAIGKRAQAAFEDLDADAASVPAGPLANTVVAEAPALAIILN